MFVAAIALSPGVLAQSTAGFPTEPEPPRAPAPPPAPPRAPSPPPQAPSPPPQAPSPPPPQAPYPPPQAPYPPPQAPYPPQAPAPRYPSPTPYPPQYPAPYVAPRYPSPTPYPPQYPAPYVAPRYPSPTPYPAPAPYVAPRYPQAPPAPGYQPYPPSGYPAPYPAPPGYVPQPPQPAPGNVPPPYPVAPPPAPPPKNPLLDDNLRYRQELGAYRRGHDAGANGAAQKRDAYVRIVPRTRHYHDGFYFRFALGLGVGHATLKADRSLPSSQPLRFEPTPLEGSIGGTAAVTELAAGYAFWPGIVIGAGIYTATIGSQTMTANDERTGDYDFRLSQLAVIGPFLDFYPSADSGFHVQGSPGVGTYVAGAGIPQVEGPIAQAHTSVGFGLMLGIGYEWWIADQWSVGFLGRLAVTTGSGTDSRGVSWDHTVYSPAVLVGLTYQ